MKTLNRYVNLAGLAFCLYPGLATAGDLPAGFVRLQDVAPTIRQDILYAGSNNFLGRPAAGYNAPVCILTTQAATALSKLQADLAAQQKSLVVFDCYRPKRAVNDFVAWVKQGGSISAQWSPKTPRANLIRDGYIGSRSAHSRGSTVDLAIIDLTLKGGGPASACGHASLTMLDFGSGFDCFDPMSRVAYPKLEPQASRNRLMLVDLMAKAGFKSYAGEWWHFTLRGDPYPNRRFDFPVD